MIPGRHFLTVLALIVLAGCHANSDESQAVIYQSVEAVPVTASESFELERAFTGVVQPARAAALAFETGGTLEFVLADEGDRVEAGDLLAQLDTALLVIERRQLEAQLVEARANLRLAEANLARQRSLESDGFASQQRRDELEAGRDAIEARILSLEAALDGNAVQQRKAHLVAPFAGVVSDRYLEEGSSAAAGVPVLRLLESGELEAHVGVPRKLAGRLAEGQPVKIRLGEAIMEGEVLAVGAELKARSHTAKVRIRIPRADVLTGALVELIISDDIESRGFGLPQSALTASLRGLWRVYALLPEKDGLYRAEARDVQLRYSGEHTAYVEGGLSDGDLVVTAGVHKIVPGQLVRLVGTGSPR